MKKRFVGGVEFACKHGYHGNPFRTARSNANTHERGRVGQEKILAKHLTDRIEEIMIQGCPRNVGELFEN